jgi:hypothetical protein
MSPARQRWNRLFFVAVICWTLFCFFVYPVLMAGKARTHYDSDFKSCYESYGVRGAAGLVALFETNG